MSNILESLTLFIITGITCGAFGMIIGLLLEGYKRRKIEEEAINLGYAKYIITEPDIETGEATVVFVWKNKTV